MIVELSSPAEWQSRRLCLLGLHPLQPSNDRSLPAVMPPLYFDPVTQKKIQITPILSIVNVSTVHSFNSTSAVLQSCRWIDLEADMYLVELITLPLEPGQSATETR